ncbi:AraC family transcriptional regulator, partial [Streptomyces werraensis]
ARARAVLEERMAAPPTLEQLAAGLGTSPFALLRAFRDTYGMPPHTWLTDARVRRARRLLDAGTTPSEAAATVGFTDQPHLNRHFSRIVGVPPGAYQRERKNVQDARGGLSVASGVWQWNGQQSTSTRTYRPTENTPRPRASGAEGSRTAPWYGTPSASGSPSDSPGSPSA